MDREQGRDGEEAAQRSCLSTILLVHQQAANTCTTMDRLMLLPALK